MKTILCPPAVRGLLLFAALSIAVRAPVFGQSVTTAADPSFANRYTITVELPNLTGMIASPAVPYYEVFVHFGDGNFERDSVYQTSVAPGMIYSFPDWVRTYTYAQSGPYSPSVSLTAKYSPPVEPVDEFVAPPGGSTNGTVNVAPYVMRGDLRRGRDIALDSTHRVAIGNARRTTFSLAWTRDQNLSGSIALFYNGIRDNTGKLGAATGAAAIMAIETENRHHLNLAGPGQNANVAGHPIFAGLSAQYGSVFTLPNLAFDNLTSEGRDLFCFRNSRDLIFNNQEKVSLLALFLTDEPKRTVSALDTLRPNFGLLKALGLPTNDDYMQLIGTAGGGGFVYDFAFYEEMPVYIHDPNEIVITSMTKDPATGNWNLTLDFTSCSHYKSNGLTQNATVEFNHTALNTGWEVTGVLQPTFHPTAVEIPPPTGGIRAKAISGIHLEGGQCFIMQIAGVLDATKVELVEMEGEILRACVHLAGETSNDPADLCSGNLKYDPNRPPGYNSGIPIDGPCGKSGPWNWLLCLCEKSPLPCWLVVVLVLVFLIWYFFKKKT